MSFLEIDGDEQEIRDSNQNEILSFGATASAVNHPKVVNAATGNRPRVEADGDDASVGLGLRPKGSAGVVVIEDHNGNEVLKAGAGVASAVNEVTVTNAATGNAPTIEPTGGDTNISLDLKAKGAGLLNLAAPVKSPVAAVQNLATGNTITLPTAGTTKRLSASGGAVTGIILAAGVADGQILILFNIEASNTITFAAAGTSNVADGASAVIGALRALVLVWDATSSRWYRTG